MIVYISILVIVGKSVMGTESETEDVDTFPKIDCHYEAPKSNCGLNGLSRACAPEKVNACTCTTTTNITLNETHPHFRFNGKPENDPIITVSFQALTMHTFTNDTCLEFPPLKYLFAKGIGLQVLLTNALEMCIDLRQVDFGENQLLRISSGTFKQHPKLEKISLANNSISTIEAKAFDNLRILTSLDISGNQIKRFPSEGQLSQVQMLIEIALTSDTLEEIDSEELLRMCPGLFILVVCENSFINKQYIKEQFKITDTVRADYGYSFLNFDDDCRHIVKELK